MRPPLSMADSLPSINFGFDDLRDRMARFTERFDTFIAKGRKQVLEERNHFRINVAELQGMHVEQKQLSGLHANKSGLTEEQRVKRRDIENIAQKSSSHAQAVDKEAAETAEMHAAIASITQQRDARAKHRDRIRTEIAAVRKQIAQRVAAQQQYAEELDAQAQSNGPELDFWQSFLGMRIEGAGVDDRLKFLFTHLDEKHWEREATFELDMAKRDYRVMNVKPRIEADEVERCVERLNETRDLGFFLKSMRALLGAALK
ncbi:MAG: hypothetical protein LQ346_000031 [Caloplaca aetnensis]|nr:MAG: hypothetical protein LQ346_000031 [Caloplaca aetnensis]